MTRVTAIIPTRDAPRHLAMVLDGLAATRWEDLEVVVVDNGSRDPEALRIIGGSGAHAVRVDTPFNFSRLINAGAAASSGDVLVLLNDDVEITDPDWLGPLVELALRPDVGPVGPVLLYPDGTIQHCGIVVDAGAPAHVALGLHPADAPGPLMDAPTRHLAVTGACMAIDAHLFRTLGGMEPLLHTSYNDVDLCLRASALGRASFVEPRVRLIHHESATRGRDVTPEVRADWLLFRTRWASVLAGGERSGAESAHV